MFIKSNQHQIYFVTSQSIKQGVGIAPSIMLQIAQRCSKAGSGHSIINHASNCITTTKMNTRVDKSKTRVHA